MRIKYTCPCCGYKTLDEKPPNTYAICEVCYWEDDGIQFDDPDYDGGANPVSLREAQKNFILIGACQSEFISSVRSPDKVEYKDPKWKPLYS